MCVQVHACICVRMPLETRGQLQVSSLGAFRFLFEAEYLSDL